jgi:hypothetical protein
METSAFADVNVRDVFELLVQEIYNVRSREDLTNRNQGGKPLVHNDPSFNKDKGCGCM